MLLRDHGHWTRYFTSLYPCCYNSTPALLLLSHPRNSILVTRLMLFHNQTCAGLIHCHIDTQCNRTYHDTKATKIEEERNRWWWGTRGEEGRQQMVSPISHEDAPKLSGPQSTCWFATILGPLSQTPTITK